MAIARLILKGAGSVVNIQNPLFILLSCKSDITEAIFFKKLSCNVYKGPGQTGYSIFRNSPGIILTLPGDALVIPYNSYQNPICQVVSIAAKIKAYCTEKAVRLGIILMTVFIIFKGLKKEILTAFDLRKNGFLWITG